MIELGKDQLEAFDMVILVEECVDLNQLKKYL